MSAELPTQPPRDVNPYAAPTAALYDGPAQEVRHYGAASRGQRFVNLVIDYLMVMALAFMAGIVLALADRTNPFENGLTGQVLGYAVMAGYYIVFEALTGRTIGKLVTGTRVLSATGGEPSRGQIVGRSFLRFVPFEPFSFLGDTAAGWHDRFSKTTVVRLRPTRRQKTSAL
jgi:uncharacterized RDD family membrane protein YckC